MEMLLSTEGLKMAGWETFFQIAGDKLVNKRSGAILSLYKGQSGLPTLELAFGEEESAFVCTPCEEEINDFA